LSIPYVNRPVPFIVTTAQAINSLENSGGSQWSYHKWKIFEAESCQLHLDWIPVIQTPLKNVSPIADWEKLEALSWNVRVISTHVGYKELLIKKKKKNLSHMHNYFLE